MKKNLILFIFFLLLSTLWGQDNLTSISIEDEEWEQEWQRVLVLQGKNESDYSSEDLQALKASVKEGLILRKVMMNLAEMKELIPSDLEVEQIYENMKRRVPDQNEWDRLLAEQLYDEDSFRLYLRESEAIDRLLEEEVLNDLIVTRKEAQEYFENHPDEFLHNGEPLSFEEVEESLTAFLMEQKGHRAISAYMDRLRNAIVTP